MKATEEGKSPIFSLNKKNKIDKIKSNVKTPVRYLKVIHKYSILINAI